MLIKKTKPHQQQGATGVIIILIMIVLLTIGISVFTGTTKDVAITSQREESTRVFHAAETGIEHALNSIYEAEKNEGEFLDKVYVGDDSNIVYDIQKLQQVDLVVPEGETIEFPIDPNTPDNIIRVFWGDKGVQCSDDPPALLISVFYTGDTRGPIVRHFAFDYCNYQRPYPNRFNSAWNTASTSEFAYTMNIPVGARAISPLAYLARITPIFNDSKIRVTADDINEGITGANDFSQYNILSRSEAKIEGEEAQAILVKRSLPAAPSFMNYALVSGSSIVK